MCLRGRVPLSIYSIGMCVCILAFLVERAEHETCINTLKINELNHVKHKSNEEEILYVRTSTYAIWKYIRCRLL